MLCRFSYFEPRVASANRRPFCPFAEYLRVAMAAWFPVSAASRVAEADERPAGADRELQDAFPFRAGASQSSPFRSAFRWSRLLRAVCWHPTLQPQARHEQAFQPLRVCCVPSTSGSRTVSAARRECIASLILHEGSCKALKIGRAVPPPVCPRPRDSFLSGLPIQTPVT